jgi:thioredoxin reductase
MAERAGVDLRTSTTAVDWSGPTRLRVADESGLSHVEAGAVVLANGVRERPRHARLVPGDRGAGVFTTGSLQQLTARPGQKPGRRAVVVGAEHVSFSAVLTLEHAGCDVVAMVTPFAHHQTYRVLRLAAATRHRVPVITGTDVAEIHGHDRVEAVTLTNGKRLECDTVVFTGGWIPDHELARHGGMEIDPSHRGPVVDGAMRTSRRGVFAIGNVIHPAETADVCALDGRHVAAHVVDWLTLGEWPEVAVRVVPSGQIKWIAPSVLRPGVSPARDRFHLRVGQFTEARTIVVSQGDHTLWHGNVVGGRLVPNRAISISAEWVLDVDPDGPDVSIAAAD